MALIWQFAEVTNRPAWKGLSWCATRHPAAGASAGAGACPDAAAGAAKCAVAAGVAASLPSSKATDACEPGTCPRPPTPTLQRSLQGHAAVPRLRHVRLHVALVLQLPRSGGEGCCANHRARLQAALGGGHGLCRGARTAGLAPLAAAQQRSPLHPPASPPTVSGGTAGGADGAGQLHMRLGSLPHLASRSHGASALKRALRSLLAYAAVSL